MMKRSDKFHELRSRNEDEMIVCFWEEGSSFMIPKSGCGSVEREQ